MREAKQFSEEEQLWISEGRMKLFILPAGAKPLYEVGDYLQVGAHLLRITKVDRDTIGVWPEPGFYRYHFERAVEYE